MRPPAHDGFRTGWNNTTGGGPGGFTHSGMVRHQWGMTALAADCRATWLKLPPFNPGAAAPADFGDLGDIVGTDQTSANWPKIGKEKLYIRNQNGNGGF